ncbi:adiponectin receptor protein-like isoform X2 [Convolutriloba macropyga]
MFTRYFCLPDAWFSSCILLEIVFKSVQKMLEIVGDRVVVVGDNFVHVGDSFVDKWNMPRRQTTKLIAHAALPEWLKDNDFLHQNHRPPIPCIATCFRSVFAIHSETVNIWTHLIGSLILVGITFWFFVRPSNVPYTWQKILVFLAFFLSAVACMTFSWLYHTLYCHSAQMSSLFSKLDYSGIAILILGSFVPWLYYGFYCDQAHMMFYIGTMVVLSTCSIILCMWDRMSSPVYRPLRTGTFVALGLSGVVPFGHSVLKHGLEHTKFPYLVTVALLYIGGALIYAFRVPERFLPGKLDIWGHSHQIFHVMVVMAAIVHYNGIITMADDRIKIGECAA